MIDRDPLRSPFNTQNSPSIPQIGDMTHPLPPQVPHQSQTTSCPRITSSHQLQLLISLGQHSGYHPLYVTLVLVQLLLQILT